MKTLKFSYNDDTVGVKVPDKADLAQAINKAFTALDLEYSEQWDVLDEGGNTVEATTKVKLFREGTKFSLRAFEPEPVPEPEPSFSVPPPQVLEPAKVPAAMSAARVAGAMAELAAVVSPAPEPLPPTPDEVAVATLNEQMGLTTAESAKVVAEMPVEIATVPLRPAVLKPGCAWPVHGQMRTGELVGEIKKVG